MKRLNSKEYGEIIFTHNYILVNALLIELTGLKRFVSKAVLLEKENSVELVIRVTSKIGDRETHNEYNIPVLPEQVIAAENLIPKGY